MLSYDGFMRAEEKTVKDWDAALRLCAGLRAKEDSKPYKIIISGGTESGQTEFPFSGFCLIGRQSVLTGNACGNQTDANGIRKTTWKTPTLTVSGCGNLFIGFKIENTAGEPGIHGTQVALSVLGDENVFLGCRIGSTQDTLFIGPLPDDLISRYQDFIPDRLRYIEGLRRNYFIGSDISGSVDFIFGAGQAVFRGCRMISVNDGRTGMQYVTAPAHSLKDRFGFLFSRCVFLGQNVMKASVYLGRPWRDYGKAVFSQCGYGPHIAKAGFSDWSAASQRYLTARFSEYPLSEGRVSWMHNRFEKEMPAYYSQALKTLEELYPQPLEK